MSRTTSRGIILMVGANIIFCAVACMVRLVSDLNAWTTTLFRFLVGIGIIGLFALSGKIKLNFVNSRGLFLRGLMGGCATAIFFYSITKLGLVRAGFIMSLYPAFAAVFGLFILKERLSPIKWGALCGGLIGALVLMGGGSTAGSVSGFDRYELLALSGAMLAGLTVVSVKKLQSTDSTVAIFFAQCLIGSMIVVVPGTIGPINLSPAVLILLLSIGILATVGQLLATDSYRYLTVASGSLLVMSAPVFTCVTGITLFHEPLTPAMAAGACIILGSSASILIEKG